MNLAHDEFGIHAHMCRRNTFDGACQMNATAGTTEMRTEKAVALQPVVDPAGWSKEDLSLDKSWKYELTA